MFSPNMDQVDNLGWICLPSNMTETGILRLYAIALKYREFCASVLVE